MSQGKTTVSMNNLSPAGHKDILALRVMCTSAKIAMSPLCVSRLYAIASFLLTVTSYVWETVDLHQQQRFPSVLLIW